MAFGILAAVAWPVVALVIAALIFIGFRQDRNEKKELARAEIKPIRDRMAGIEAKMNEAKPADDRLNKLEADIKKLSTKVNLRD